MTPEQAARAFLEACTSENWNATLMMSEPPRSPLGPLLMGDLNFPAS